MFHLRLLGPLQIDQDGIAVRGFESRKALGLLGYLVERGQPLARSHLADFFWPDRPEAQGRANLSRALYSLSSLLPGCLETDRHTVQFQPSATFWIDTRAFAEFVAQGQNNACAAAVDLYRDDFMTDVALNDCPEFELWLVRTREQWRQRVTMLLDTLVTHHSAQHEYAPALQFANRLVMLEPWREEAHRQTMQLLAWSGQRSAAVAHYETCRRRLAEELGVEPSAETLALREAIQMGRLDRETGGQGDKENFVDPISLSPGRPLGPLVALPIQNGDAALHNLPAALTSFVGREAEIAQLGQYLLHSTTRLVTIVGEGGVGKTRLALAVGQKTLDFGFWILDFPSTSLPDNPKSKIGNPKFPDGVWFVPLAGVEGGGTGDVANGLATAVARVLAFAFGSAAVAPAAQLLSYLRSKALLLILDNFEHLTTAAPFVVELLQQAPQVRVLVTSRTPLNCQAEQLLHLEGLPVALVDAPATPHVPSITLFSERVRRQIADFVLTAETLPEVTRLCQLVNGNPLALELAAHWVQQFSVSEIIDALHRHDLALLTTDQQDVPARHRTMLAVFATSWQLLSPSHQRALAQLAVFRGSFTRAAALAVTDATLADLLALVNSSLLWQERTPAGQLFYSIHELLRQFAVAKLSTLEASQPAPQVTTTQRHSAYYLRLVATHGPALYTRQMKSALGELLPAIDNLQAAWRWAVTQGNLALLDEAWFGLRSFYHVRSLFQEGEEVFRLAAAQLRTHARLPTDELLAEIEITQAFFLNLMHRYEPAIGLAQAVLARLAQPPGPSDPTPAQAQAGLEWGIALALQGKHEEAEVRLTVAVELAYKLALPVVAARALRARQRSLVAQGAFKPAIAVLEEALHLYQQVGYRLAEGFVLRSLALYTYYLGDYAKALAALEEAQRIYQQADDQPRLISLWKYLGDVYMALGDWGRAHHYYRAAHTQCNAVHDPLYSADTLEGYARLLGRLGDFAQAQQYGQQALTLHRQVEHPHGMIEALCTLGWLQNQVGNPAAALTHYRAASALIQHSSAQLFAGMALLGSGKALLGLGQAAEATAVYHQALAVQRTLGQQHWVLQTLSELAAVALTQARLADALPLVDEILTYWPSSTPPGANEPMRVYLICYQVLQANHDPRAGSLLQQAQVSLQTQVATIDDASLRQSFLETVAVNQALMAAYKQRGA